jgi:hypothetical protein
MNKHIDGVVVCKIIIIEAKQRGVKVVQLSNLDDFSRTKTTIFQNR